MNRDSLRVIVVAVVVLSGCSGGRETREARPSPSPGMPEEFHSSSGAGRVALEGPRWTLIELNGDPLAGQERGRLPYIHLDGGTTRFDGFGGCNRIGGVYTTKGDSLNIGPLISTQMACPDPQMELEHAFTRALGACRNWKIEGEVLSLSTHGRVVARLIPHDGENPSERTQD
jgi:heat shock protein HslJ